MGSGLDILGAVDIGSAALAEQVVSVRVLDVDREKLKEAVGGASGALASLALSLVDKAPKAALDVAKPLLVGQAKSYGITLDVSVAKSPMTEGRALSEFWPGLLAGGVIGVSILGIVKLAVRIFER